MGFCRIGNDHMDVQLVIRETHSTRYGQEDAEEQEILSLRAVTANVLLLLTEELLRLVK